MADATLHLARAKDYIGRGEEFYRKAAAEIAEAMNQDGSLTYARIGESLGHTDKWVGRLVRWSTTGDVHTPFAEEKGKVAERHARSVMREAPMEQVEQIIAALPPERQRKLATALDTESAKRQKAREQIAKQKERDHLGDELVDGLELREELQSTEYLLIKARGNLRGFVKHVGEIGATSTPEAWRASCLDWIEDLEGHLGMARALLAGDDIDWTAFEELLAKEGR